MIDILYDSPEVWFNCECGESLTLKHDRERKECKCGKVYEFAHRVAEVNEKNDPRP